MGVTARGRTGRRGVGAVMTSLMVASIPLLVPSSAAARLPSPGDADIAQAPVPTAAVFTSASSAECQVGPAQLPVTPLLTTQVSAALGEPVVLASTSSGTYAGGLDYRVCVWSGAPLNRRGLPKDRGLVGNDSVMLTVSDPSPTVASIPLR